MKNTFFSLLILLLPVLIFTQEKVNTEVKDSIYLRPIQGETNAFLTNGKSYFQFNYFVDRAFGRWFDAALYSFNFGLNERSMLTVASYSIKGFGDFNDIQINYENIVLKRKKIALAVMLNSVVDTGVDNVVLYPSIKMSYGNPRSNLTVDFRPNFLFYFTIPGFEFNTTGNFFSNSNLVISGIYGFKQTGISLFSKNYFSPEDLDIWANQIGIVYDNEKMRWVFNLENQKIPFFYASDFNYSWNSAYSFSVAFKL